METNGGFEPCNGIREKKLLRKILSARIGSVEGSLSPAYLTKGVPEA